MLGAVGGLGRGLVGAGTAGLSALRATAGAMAGDYLGRRPSDPFEELDPEFIRATLPVYKAIADVLFRPKVRGLEHIPPGGPVLLVGNHSGGTMIADTFAFSYAFYRHFGPERRFHQLAHDIVLTVPGLAGLRRYGTVAASHENAERALGAGAALLVYPGGDWESFRPSWQGNRVDFGGRSGFVRLALAQDVPIVPVVAIGGQETAFFATRGERLASLLRLDRTLRLKVLPIQFGPPFGVTVLDFPFRFPLPSQVTIQVLPMMHPRRDFGADADPDEVLEELRSEMQTALDALAAERDLPVIGTLGRRGDDPA